MAKKIRFISLKWKFSLQVGAILMSLYLAAAYIFYYKVIDNFEQGRSATQTKQINIANALTRDSFSVLERFVESVVMVPESTHKQGFNHIITMFDEHWLHWQMIWGLNNVVFYDLKADVIQQWGMTTPAMLSTINQVIKTESPQHQVICIDACFQQVVTPVLSNGEIVGVISITQSLADTLLRYQQALKSDIGLIVEKKSKNFSIITNAEKNKGLWFDIQQNYDLNSFMDKVKSVRYENHVYEVRAFLIEGQVQSSSQFLPYYLLINDITLERNHLDKELSQLLIVGLLGLLVLLLVLIVVVQKVRGRLLLNLIILMMTPIGMTENFQTFMMN